MSSKPFEFESALRELEEITRWFESGDADLDAGLEKFERGMELAAELKKHLATVENRVEKIKQRFSANAPTEPATAAEPPAEPEPEPADSSGQAGLFGA